MVIKGKGGKTGKGDFNSKTKGFEFSPIGLVADQPHVVEKAVKALLA